MERYFIVIAAGICGAFLAQRLHMPGGAVVGSMIFSGIAALMIPEGVSLSPRMGTTVQIILGISLGMTFNRSFLELGVGIIPLAIISALILMVVAVCLAPFQGSLLQCTGICAILFGHLDI